MQNKGIYPKCTICNFGLFWYMYMYIRFYMYISIVVNKVNFIVMFIN